MTSFDLLLARLEAGRTEQSFTISVDPDGRITAGLDAEVAEGLADSGDLTSDLTDLLLALGDAAKEHKTGVVLLLDEIQFLRKQRLEAIVAALHKTVQHQLPITMVGAGLPQIAELAGEAKSYAERLFKFPDIGGLSEADANAAISKPAQEEGAQFDEDALALAAEVTGRYPYFIQELGYAAWTLASEQCGPTRSGLIEKGLLYTPSHGYAAFTVPHFDQFMRRSVPRLTVPELRPRRKRTSSSGAHP